MKKKTIINIVGSTTIISAIAACAIMGISHFDNNPKQVKAYDVTPLTKDIDLNDTAESTIRNYYSALNSLSEEERNGKNLLKNLKPILMNGQKYYGYDSSAGDKIWQMYEITDRDWVKSPASEIPGYDASTNKITGYTYGTSSTSSGTNPYIHALYVDRSMDNKMHAWALEGTTTSNHGNNGNWCIDREHIWAKAHGFNGSESTKGGARGDPMHLWPGDSDVNSSLHNDQMYGFVENPNTAKAGKWDYGKKNYVGKSLTLGTSISTEDVFEPQDSDKGDIARAIFYMVARYNYIAKDGDTIDSNNPNLELAQTNEIIGGYTSSKTTTGKMGIMTDLLYWHHLDPVDEFEVHRNNLLYTNYTNNRNPFIDFPDWVDYIWGTVTYDGRNFVSKQSATGVANPQTDPVSKTSTTPPTPVTPDNPDQPEDNKQGFDWSKNWWIIVVAVVVVIVIIIGISVGVIKVTKKGKLKVKAPKAKKTSSKKKKK